MMRTFHGDLLLGGAALRELDGVLEDADDHWRGEFLVADSLAEQVECGRPYLLMLDDGRCNKVHVTEMCQDNERHRCVIRFDAG